MDSSTGPHRETHPKDRDVPGFTRDSMGRLKPGYHNPTRVSGMDVSGDTGFSDTIGIAMYGESVWKSRRKRAHRNQRIRDAIAWFFIISCLIISLLITTAAVLSLILLTNWLVSLL